MIGVNAIPISTKMIQFKAWLNDTYHLFVCMSMSTDAGACNPVDSISAACVRSPNPAWS